MADSSNPRPLKYPYTIPAQVMRFPYKHYWNNSWLFKYWAIATVVCAPLFWKLQKMSFSEENQREWNERRRKEFEGHH